MEFLGFSAENFEFFRKKDKMSKAEYEKSRNEVKLHFRCLCYDMQKLYHKNTAGVLEINKEFSNFNKRSLNISADYGKVSKLARNVIEMNIDNVAVKLQFMPTDEETAKIVLDRLKETRHQVMEYLAVEKHNQLQYSARGKGNRMETIRLHSIDVTDKSYDEVVAVLEDGVGKGRYDFELAIQHTCPKAEAIKQEKNLPGALFEDMLAIMDLHSRLVLS